MNAFISLVFLLFFSSITFANTDKTSSQAVSVQNTNKSMGGIFEFSFGTTNESHLKSDKDLGLQLKDTTPWSLFLGLNGRENENRYFLGFGLEKLGEYTSQSGESESIANFFFKFSYDRRLGPWITDWYLNTAVSWAPPQGQQIQVNGANYAPEATLGAEVGLGWLSPLGVAFTLGYKTAYHSYEYYTAGSIKNFASVYYGGVFLTTSIGRF